MTRAEMLSAALLLDAAAEVFANHTCNDYALANTDENWSLVDAATRWANPHEPESWRDRPPRASRIWTDDWLLMRYHAHLLRTEAGK